MGLIIETKNLIKRTDNSIYIIKEKIKRIEKRVRNNVECEQEKPSFNCLYKQCDDIEWVNWWFGTGDSEQDERSERFIVGGYKMCEGYWETCSCEDCKKVKELFSDLSFYWDNEEEREEIERTIESMGYSI